MNYFDASDYTVGPQSGVQSLHFTYSAASGRLGAKYNGETVAFAVVSTRHQLAVL